MNVPSLGIHVQWVPTGATGWQLTQVQTGSRASRSQPALMVGDVIERVNTQLPIGSHPSRPYRVPANSGDLDAACRHRPLSLEVLRPVMRFTGPSMQRMWINIP